MTMKQRIVSAFSNTKQKLEILELARIEQQKEINDLKAGQNVINEILGEFSERITALEKAYATDPRRAEVKPEPVPIVKGITPYSVRRRTYERQHADPEAVAKRLAPAAKSEKP
jgi:hypothetical protein